MDTMAGDHLRRGRKTVMLYRDKGVGFLSVEANRRKGDQCVTWNLREPLGSGRISAR